MNAHFPRNEFDLISAREMMPADQFDALLAWHRTIGLCLTFAGSEVPVTLDGSAPALTTEILRLAAIGLRTEHVARLGLVQPQVIVSEADIAWKKRF